MDPCFYSLLKITLAALNSPLEGNEDIVDSMKTLRFSQDIIVNVELEFVLQPSTFMLALSLRLYPLSFFPLLSI